VPPAEAQVTDQVAAVASLRFSQRATEIQTTDHGSACCMLQAPVYLLVQTAPILQAASQVFARVELASYCPFLQSMPSTITFLTMLRSSLLPSGVKTHHKSRASVKTSADSPRRPKTRKVVWSLAKTR
jgi:hypothetical protein